MKYLAILLGVVILVGIVALFIPFGEKDTDTSNPSTSSNRQHDVALQHADGTQTSIGAFISNEHVLVVNSWATWCPFCVQELPDLVLLQEEFPETIQVIAVNRRENVDEVQTYLTDLGVVEGLTYLYDSRDDWYRGNGGFTMPETLFINTRGETVVHKRGFMALEEMREHVQTTLASTN